VALKTRKWQKNVLFVVIMRFFVYFFLLMDVNFWWDKKNVLLLPKISL